MKKILLSTLVLTSAIVSGCSSPSDKAAKSESSATPTPIPQESSAPVTLKLYQQGIYFTDEDFATLIANPVKKKYPYITVEKVVSKVDLDKMVAANEDFDFFVTWNGRLPYYKELGVFGDITPLAKKMNFDLNKFNQGPLDAVRVVSDKNELWALPFTNDMYALYYNKDIFDKFGVSYPTDGMTWEDAIELGKKLTRNEGGVQYSGFAPQSLIRLLFPLSLNIVDSKTNKPLVDFDLYKRAYEVGKEIYSIPGNKFNSNPDNQFMKDKTLAMEANIGIFQQLKLIPDLNWDVAQYPSYKEKPNTYGMSNGGVIIPNKNSKHQEDMMRVFEVFFSDEVQTIYTSKVGQLSVMKDPKYNQLFGSEIPQLQGKHLSSIFKSKNAPSKEYSLYYNQAYTIMQKKFTDVLNGKDINSALSEAQDEINQYIDGVKK